MIFLLMGCTKSSSNVIESPTHTIPQNRCGSCHKEQEHQWQQSRHAVSWTNAIFEVSYYESSYQSWCRDCHRPSIPISFDIRGHENGVGCVTCHMNEKGEILSSNIDIQDQEAPHSLVFSPKLGTSEFCAQCHQFTFQPDHPMFSEVAVQNTYEEWVHSEEKKQCQGCHMGSVGHTFPGAHNEQMLKNSIDIDIIRKDGDVQITLLSKGVGHAFPTGDPFRRLVWKLCLDEKRTVCIAEKILAIVHHGDPWSIKVDQRLHPNIPKVFSYTTPKFELWWELSYYFGDPMFESFLDTDDVKQIIDQGYLPILDE